MFHTVFQAIATDNSRKSGKTVSETAREDYLYWKRGSHGSLLKFELPAVMPLLRLRENVFRLQSVAVNAEHPLFPFSFQFQPCDVTLDQGQHIFPCIDKLATDALGLEIMYESGISRFHADYPHGYINRPDIR
ncbi:hypothetical protein SAMN05216412_11086 [Nitrosospira multiformis]|uniref:Uncharacterized protein n=1 Tax=Nitrosospira multiformis TaxID=1231 RepID=A0A1I0FW44_9PROT|nr:hypothetical protein SAMN05216412_11086 [Nitrosospira multiformis]